MSDHAVASSPARPVAGELAGESGAGPVAVLGEQLSRLIRSASRFRSHRFGDPQNEKAAYFLLFHLVREGPLRASALAELASADPSAVSRQIADLVSGGLAERRPDPDDRRAQLIQVTAAGREAVTTMWQRRNAHLAIALVGWPAADLDSLAELLTRLVTDLEAHRASVFGCTSPGHHGPGSFITNREEN
jgi:DNA-binding MarR family transcriptional regulator